MTPDVFLTQYLILIFLYLYMDIGKVNFCEIRVANYLPISVKRQLNAIMYFFLINLMGKKYMMALHWTSSLIGRY